MKIQFSDRDGGFVLVTAMLLLVILTIVGTLGTRTAVQELKIAGNDRRATQEFWVVDSAWQLGGVWLTNQKNPPLSANQSTINDDDDDNDDDLEYVKNYGEDGSMNESFSDGTEDGSFAGTDYWYRISDHGNSKSLSFGKGYRNFHYIVDASAGKQMEISTRVNKVYKVGY